MQKKKHTTEEEEEEEKEIDGYRWRVLKMKKKKKNSKIVEERIEKYEKEYGWWKSTGELTKKPEEEEQE